MLVASNTSPISNLAIIGRLGLLWLQFHVIWVPNAVHSEILQLPYPAALEAIQSAFRDGWIRLRPLLYLKVARLLATTRSAAEQAGLRVTGVLGVLPRAKRDGAIEALEPEIAALRNRARSFVSKRLQEEVLKIAGE